MPRPAERSANTSRGVNVSVPPKATAGAWKLTHGHLIHCRQQLLGARLFSRDVLTIIKTAWMFVENEPHDQVILSLHDSDPLNFLWERFIAVNSVTVIHDHWEKGDRDRQYAAWGDRLVNRRVKGIAFDTYKELYPRLDGGARQNILCGSENGIGRKNIFCYYYFGQQAWVEQPAGGDTFGPGVIQIPGAPRLESRSVFLAPHEKCHGNAVFTHAFWEAVVKGLTNAEVHVTLNDDRGFLAEVDEGLIVRTYLPFRQLVEQIAAQRLVVCGNTGPGWLAGALGTPLIALERNQVLVEYEFSRCGVRSLVEVIAEPDVERTVGAVLHYLEKSS